MRDFWSPLQDTIQQLCLSFDKKWQIRKRVIDTHFLVLFVFKLVLSKNQQGYKSLLNELWESPEISGHQQNPISASSLCEARKKMPATIFTELNRAILSKQEQSDPLPRWRGHRVFAVDGSKINLPHELLSEGYKTPNEDLHYPQGLMSTVYHLGSGLIYDCLLSATDGERYCVIKHMDTLLPGDVLVLDRGYFSYLVLYKAIEKGIHLVCRLQSGKMNKAIEAFWGSDLIDVVIIYKPSASVKSALKKQGYQLDFQPIELRLFKYKIDGVLYVCATTLIGEEYPLSEFPSVYHGRWGIEELYKISKQFIDVEDFHGKSERGVKQELYAHVLLINIARIFESEANKQLPLVPDNQGEGRDEPEEIKRAESEEIKGSYWQDFCGAMQELKVNFKNCILVVGRFLEKLVAPIKHETVSCLSKILTSISRVRQKIRPGRHSPRRSRKPINKWRSSNATKKAVA